jgi:hypothetical protein
VQIQFAGNGDFNGLQNELVLIKVFCFTVKSHFHKILNIEGQNFEGFNFEIRYSVFDILRFQKHSI